MSKRESTAAALEEVDGTTLERENRELTSKQVRRINDTLRKVRSISRQSQQLTAEQAPLAAVTEEVASPRRIDPRRERDDNTDKILIPEPTLAPSVSEVFRTVFEVFEQECAQFRYTRTKNSPVMRRWKLV